MTMIGDFPVEVEQALSFSASLSEDNLRPVCPGGSPTGLLTSLCESRGCVPRYQGGRGDRLSSCRRTRGDFTPIISWLPSTLVGSAQPQPLCFEVPNGDPQCYYSVFASGLMNGVAGSKDAFLHVPIYLSYWWFLQLVLGTADDDLIVHHRKVLPFGLATAPRVFTKLLAPVVAHLHLPRCQMYLNIDDIFHAQAFRFSDRWGVHHRISSAHFPQSNGHAEVAVRKAKRIHMSNVSPTGSLDNDGLLHALLQVRNTPDRDCNVSPAEVIFGRPLHDAFSFTDHHVKFNNPSVRPMWWEAWALKEKAMRTCCTHSFEALSQHTRQLHGPSPPRGSCVSAEPVWPSRNQVGQIRYCG